MSKSLLILSVGSNPLPNYVTSWMLIRNPADWEIALIHSNETADVAKKLRSLLPDVAAIELLEISDLSCIDSIKRKFEQALNNHNGKVHLNYTGGTKQMVVHGYLAVQNKVGTENFESSYLDARQLKLCWDQAGTNEDIPVKLSLKTLMEMHDIELDQKKLMTLPRAKDAKTLRIVKFLANHKDHLQTWNHWIVGNIKAPYPQYASTQREDNGKYKSEETLRSLTVSELPELPIHKSNIEVLRIETTATDSEQKRLGKCKDLCDWYAGNWLEDYVLGCLKEIDKCAGIHEVAMGVERKEPKFELDVVAMRNHQVFVFSCTTEDRKGSCKYKLFEAYARARQIGGDEARTALVCLSENPDGIKKEVEKVLDSHIHVFGRSHLEDLAREICLWIKKESRQETICSM